MPSHEHPQEALCVRAIGLEAPSPAAHLDARRVKNAVVDASRFQQAMEPEAVIAGLIAGVDLGRLNALSRCRGSGSIKKSKQALGIATGDLVEAHLAQMRQAKSDNPLRLAELDGCKNPAALASAVGALNGPIVHRTLLCPRGPSMMPED